MLFQEEPREICGQERDESATLESEVRVTISFLKGYKYFINSAIVSVQRTFYFALHFETYEGEVLYTFFPAKGTLDGPYLSAQEKTLE